MTLIPFEIGEPDLRLPKPSAIPFRWGFSAKLIPSAITLTKENETWTTKTNLFPVVRVAVSRYGSQSPAKSARKDERLSVSRVRRILVIAIAVGFCISISPSQAVAPVMTAQMFANSYPKAFAHQRVMAQWKSQREYVCQYLS